MFLIDCVGHYGSYLAVSVFFNVHIVSRSTAEISTPISAVLELRSCANLPCLVNLAQKSCTFNVIMTVTALRLNIRLLRITM